jgi:2-polyprenyl-6-methoxyphenol hydroxylase-like FAD-dependent oxidoreductase
VLWYPFTDSEGHGGLAGSYWIPGQQPTERVLNWGVYDVLSDADLRRLIPQMSVDGEQRMAAHQLTTQALDYFYELIDRQLPANTAAILEQTPAPFLQLIVDISSDCLVQGLMALLGDAAAVLRLHSAGGAVKALIDGISPANSIVAHDDIALALRHWNDQQLPVLKQQMELSLALGAGWITEAPQWQLMDPVAMDDWWNTMLADFSWYIK